VGRRIRTLTNREDKFRLKTAGWGTFLTRAEVTLRTGEVIKPRHELCLTHEDGTPTDA
jgi:hypothetical protein